MGIDKIKNDNLVILVNKYADMVLRLAFTYLGNQADAQDACQDVFIKLFKHQRHFNDGEHEKAWIIRVTINTCKDIIRSPWKKWFSSIEYLPNNHTESIDVVSFVVTLPRKYRMVIHLYYYEGYKTTEISEILNIKESTIRTQLKRAKELLKEKMLGGSDDDDQN
ncbi:sigma-70 family RNA polymerase sigma factor [Paenibacillus sp. SYP-B3998]|uniref:Sigma-70 family RNA polymerase sigma factor n=1 Tax=Paenibacillus sp. SYP-B3998 TaxID=2678564 RepID=A0A6G3ZWB7_9BACL|nr:sigma-70 family RNA polymerase sigma factor [Paenibacillus sp. SYP-B3998]NEW06338.1 sigma-70 family RNA polymerase sigma factor [Paenibacillus sp. SYP-B3998]